MIAINILPNLSQYQWLFFLDFFLDISWASQMVDMSLQKMKSSHRNKAVVTEPVISKRIKEEKQQSSVQANHSKRQRPLKVNLDQDIVVSAPKRHRTKETAASTHPAWYNGTEYQCQICCCVCYDRCNLVLHINYSHGKNVEEYRHEFGQLTTKRINYQCQICDQYVNHEQEVIER